MIIVRIFSSDIYFEVVPDSTVEGEGDVFMLKAEAKTKFMLT